jgi:putative hemolysin
MTGITLVTGIFGIVLAGFFTAARMTFILADRKEIQNQHQQGKTWASKALSLIERPSRLFQVSRMGVELSMLGSATLVLWFTLRDWGWTGFSLSIPALLLGFILIGELLPMTLVAKKPHQLMRFMTRGISLASWVFLPWLLIQRLAFARDSGRSERQKRGVAPSVSRQELTWLIRGEEDEDNTLLQEERKIINRIFQFSETQVKEVMIPLVEVSAIEETATVGEVIHRVDQEGYSRFPVYRGRIDHILGIIHSFDFLGIASLDEPVGPYVRKTSFVPESMPVDELMLQLQREGNHMAIVVDEYGGSVGIVTMEDLLEEIVGEIQDEFDIQEDRYKELSPSQFLVNARMEIDEVNELLALGLPKEDCETLGGFLLKAFRRIPKKGESLIVGDVQYDIQKADERSIQEILITLPRRGETSEDSKA